MTGIEFLATLVATGSLHGLTIGSPVSEVDRAIHGDHIDVPSETGLSLRRDYGFVEFGFDSDPDVDWVMKGCGIQLHRLPYSPDLAEEWSRAMGVDFPPYTAWTDLREEMVRHGVADLETKDQKTFLAYRAPHSKVSVIVNNVEEERDNYVGFGDVWAVHLG
ncbi:MULTISPECIES: hypothetical protein [Streptomyces]|uniref:hypothetical protein n=1 Tax=Streptomyces TaxID=1883 RepID=UPI00343540EF